jgi:putative acetyltransferase
VLWDSGGVPHPDICIRPERPDDGRTVHDLTLEAFGTGSEVVADLVDALRDSDAFVEGLSFVAEVQSASGEAVVGHTMLTRSWVDADRELVKVLVLSPLSVAPGHQRRGVGSELVLHALAEADEAGWPAVFLEGDPAYYSRLGFERASTLGFSRPGTRIPDAACQVVTLSAFEPWMTGALVYADRFWALDCVGLR